MDLMKFLSPKHVILVHGEKPKMEILKAKIQSELGIHCYDPANNETVSLSSTHYVKAVASEAFVRTCSNPNFKFVKSSSENGNNSSPESRNSMPRLQVTDERVGEGVLVMEKGKKAKVVHEDELLVILGETKHNVKHSYCFPIYIQNLDFTDRASMSNDTSGPWLRLIFLILSDELPEGNVQDFGEHLQVESLSLSICSEDNCAGRISDNPRNKPELVFCCCVWSREDEKIAWKVISILENFDVRSIKGQLLPNVKEISPAD